MISIDWATKVISVPQSYLTLVSGMAYSMDVNQFRLDLKDLEDSEEGMNFDYTHNHNTAVTLSGTTYARTLEIVNGYTVTFEDTGSPYVVAFVGANHNIADVTNFDMVSLVIGNSAGLIVTENTIESSVDPADIASQVWDSLKADHTAADTMGQLIQDLERITKQIKSISSANL